jgi:hypothetical protein
MSAKKKAERTKPSRAATPCSALPGELDALVIHMRNVAARMDYYGGFNVEIRQHAKELDGAANITRGWAKRMRAGKAARLIRMPNACGEPAGAPLAPPPH